MLLDDFLVGYDKRLRPGFGGAPTLVDVNMNIRSMGPISEIDMAYQMDCYFRQSWVDKRLQFKGPLQTLPVSIKILHRIWKPDTHFLNGKESYLHTVTTPNKLLRINRDGRLLLSMRLTIKASCPMHLEKYPMDVQICPIRLASHGYGEDDVLYTWTHGADGSIKMAPDMKLSQYDLVGLSAGNATSMSAGQRHSVLYAQFVLRRHTGYFLINFYMPCSLLVVISWVGFWINREATADRIALGITTVLTMAFLGVDNRQDLPKISYSTALDLFVGVCFMFVVASIIQFASVHYSTTFGNGEVMTLSDDADSTDDETTLDTSMRDFPRPRYGGYGGMSSRSTSKSNGAGSTSSSFAHAFDDSRAIANGKSGRYKMPCLLQLWNCLKGNSKYRDMKLRMKPWGTNSVSRIDRFSRVSFPLAFSIFQVLYWLAYFDFSTSGQLET
ncbi:hypothetical protein NP493_994g01006 [Ridgeia piscesae]|uniref:Gamma-aminobutyric acid receptor alpha-like n=1 Tax=Ridgeia piscesae TaxID=27915 RepID=A0AAD9KJ26_RIDPI|nr:hypothetical protein NP493_994g01006 [Ridgeia piscesae]